MAGLNPVGRLLRNLTVRASLVKLAGLNPVGRLLHNLTNEGYASFFEKSCSRVWWPVLKQNPHFSGRVHLATV